MTALFVMPLRTYLTGRYRAAWEGGAPAAVADRSDEEADRFVEAVRAALDPFLGSRPDWDEEGGVAEAVTLSAEAYVRPLLAAARYPGVHDFSQLRRLEDTAFWLPVAFESPFRIPHPFDPEARIVAGSSPKLRDEMVRLERLLVQEPEMAEPGSAPPEFRDRVDGVRLMLRLATASAERRLPLIAEG